MTTFPPEAPSSLHPAPLFALVIPRSICVHLPLLNSSRFPHHNRSFSFSVSHFDAEEKSSALIFGFVLSVFFLVIFTSEGSLFGAFSQVLASLLPAPPLPFSCLCRPVLCFFTTLPLSMTQNSATEPPMLVAFSITKTEEEEL